MILSRVLLRPAHPEVNRWRASFQALHGALWRLFPAASGEVAAAPTPPPPGGRARLQILHHLSPDPIEGAVELLVQSGAVPSWEGWDARAYARAPESKVVPSDLVVDGALLRFRLVGSAVSRVCKWQRKATKPVQFYRTDEEMHRWLSVRLAAAGAELLGVPLWRRLPDRCPPRAPHPNATQFDGILRVKDPAALTAARENGVGRGRSYGCGLLLLARAPGATSP